MIARHPNPRVWAPLLGALLVSLALIGPWGNFPLNDDWLFSAVGKELAESGQFSLGGRPVAPNLVGQVVLAAPWILVFGFSHTLLRVMTLVLAVILLYALDCLLRSADVAPPIRLGCLLVLLFNPIFLYSATTFMTEIHGYFPAMLGVTLWMAGRSRSDDERLISWSFAVPSAALIGWSFWTRQICVLVFPALIASTIGLALLGRNRKRLARSMPVLAAAAAAFALVIAAHMVWSAGSGRASATFSQLLPNLVRFDPAGWLLQTGVFITYMTAFFLPVLILVPLRGLGTARALLSGGIVLSIVVASYWMVLRVGSADASFMSPLHRGFPFLGNIVNDTGIGPVTTGDVFMLDLERPRWNPAVWRAIHVVFVLLSALWGPVLLRCVSMLRRGTGKLDREVLLFGLALSLGTFIVTVQAYWFQVFDRYYFPSILGLMLVLGVVSAEARQRDRRADRTPYRRPLVFLLALAPLGFFTVAGLHDMFRWNEARWTLNTALLESGVSPLNVHSGYEVEGWFAFDDHRAEVDPPDCIGECFTDTGCWYCRDESYRIGMNVYGGYETIDSIQPRYWLAAGPPVVVSKRPAGPDSALPPGRAED